MLSFSSNSFANCNPIPRLEPVTHTVTFVSASPGTYLLSFLLLLIAAAAFVVVVVLLVVFAPTMSPMTMRCVPKNPWILVELVVVALLMRRELLFPKPPKQNFLLMKALLFKEEEEDKEAAFVVKVVAWRIFCAKVSSLFLWGCGKAQKKYLGCPNLTKK